jgi:hypothetical protein
MKAHGSSRTEQSLVSRDKTAAEWSLLAPDVSRSELHGVGSAERIAIQ